VLNSTDRRVHTDVDPYSDGCINKLLHEGRVESLERTGAPMQYMDLGTGTSRHVGKLKRDVTTADKDHSAREVVEFKELRTRGKVLLPRNVQPCWCGTRSYHNGPGGEHIAIHPDTSSIHKVSAPLKRFDACIAESLPAILWNRIGERSLELHEFGPVDLHVSQHDVPFRHAPVPVDQLGRADENFLGITPTERARAAERLRVNDGDLPAL
jgi:hypothetical protein